MTSSDRLSEIRKRRDAVTPIKNWYGAGRLDDFGFPADDADFIANAPADIDWLIEQYAALRSKLAEVRAQIDAACDEWEASGDDERLVNDVLDPLVKSLAILDREETDRG